ncbi:MAG: A/G-specific adenine glycosylase [Candidatus Paceibacterota bacterium]|jgi:A/G-specific adenine glycosylase
MDKKSFQKEIWTYYKNYGRKLPWRNIHNPYRIFVSELMLQQTQVVRVLKKYPEFIKAFPTFKALADAKFSDVLLVWQGMGYNRRAKFMKQTAEIIIRDFNGIVPRNIKTLKTLPGIGSGTAGSLSAFIYNEPVCFIETNIRRVMIHFFFREKNNIKEKDILKKIKETIDVSNPREWYYALMDYGVMLPKKEKLNANKKSTIYKKQTSFIGSRRQLRGSIIRFLLKNKASKISDIVYGCGITDYSVEEIVSDLCKERLVRKSKNRYSIFEN